MRVLLLNPPSERTVIRDYFCSKTTKSNYLYHPIDLVMLSGTVAERHDLTVLDALAEGLDFDAALRRIDEAGAEVVVSLVGAVSWNEDRAFLAAVHAAGLRVIALGDIFQEDAERRLAEEPWLEATLHGFADADLLSYLDGDLASIREMTVRDAAGDPLSLRRDDARRRGGSYRVPRPRHELFPETGYRFSFAKGRRFATVLTDYGCPYPCTFCIMGTLGFETRPVDDVLDELDHLRAGGTKEFFFLDQTFGLPRARGLKLCAALEERGDLSWTAFQRPDNTDDELLGAMRRAGCHTLILGVESPDAELLARYRKGYDTGEVAAGVARAKAHGFRVVGTFLIGLPEEDEHSWENTLRWALELDLDYLSLNVAVPRFGTPFRKRALELGLCREDELVMDQAGATAALPTQVLGRRDIERVKRRLVRRFYLRPRYLARRLRGTGSLRQLGSELREGLALLRRNV